jgi:hypothetical protein
MIIREGEERVGNKKALSWKDSKDKSASFLILVSINLKKCP